MAEDFTRVTLFVPGRPATMGAWGVDGFLRERSIDVELVENDGTFGEAFSFGTVEPEPLADIEGAGSGLVLYSKADFLEGRAGIVEIARRLREAGALAVRIENSKVGFAIDRWIRLFSSDDPWDWHRAGVFLLEDEETVQTVGMHAYSLPDAVVPVAGDADEARRFATILDIYQIAEDPLLLSGQTFAPDRETPKRVLERWPDVMYPRGHPCHNPYGIWRVGPPGGDGRAPSEPTLVFVPALVVVLTNLEEKAGRPLTRVEVEAARDAGACIAMEHGDAKKLERSRGYADLEPELVWEQWALVRGA